MARNKSFVLTSRPTRIEAAGPHNFSMVESDTDALADGEVLVRNHYLSLDPYMRGRMNDAPSYAAPQPLGEVMTGRTVGEVVESRNARYKTGDLVNLTGGWQLYCKSDGREMRKIDASAAPMQTYLGVLGMPGVTAWFGLHQIIAPKAGETVVVSAATGAVGAVVGQLAKIAGAHVVGIAGGAEKCAYACDQLGLDACVDHRSQTFADDMKAALPRGVDGLFENVGAAPFAQSMRRLNPFARIAICGLVASGYDGTPTNLPDVRVLLEKRAMMRGFIISDHLDFWPQALRELGEHVKTGRLRWRESVADGLESAPTAFFSMLKGGNFGKQLVKLV
jgi:NADPH-dependent curcumin reductase CurA